MDLLVNMPVQRGTVFDQEADHNIKADDSFLFVEVKAMRLQHARVAVNDLIDILSDQGNLFVIHIHGINPDGHDKDAVFRVNAFHDAARKF